MMCQQCGQKSATLHFTKIINGEKTEFHICESCARDKGELIPGAPNGFSIHNLLSGLLDFDMTNGSSQLQSGLYGIKSTQEVMRCDHCGLTFSQFSKMGRFGCDACYKSFASRLDPLLKRVHGNIVHVGKIPKRNGIVMQRKRELIALREKLQLSIQQEQFETAAQLRDEIRKIEQDLSGEAEAK